MQSCKFMSECSWAGGKSSLSAKENPDRKENAHKTFVFKGLLCNDFEG